MQKSSALFLAHFLSAVTLMGTPKTAFCQDAADTIISKYVNFIGGEVKWRKIKTIVTTGTYNYGGVQFPFTSYAKAPNKYKYIVPSGGKYFAQGYDGKKGWKIDKFKNESAPTTLSGTAARAMANESDVDLLPPLLNYRDKHYQVVYDGEDTVNGNLCARLKLTRSGEDTGYYSIKKDDGQLLKKQIRSKNVEMEGSIIDIFYSDYIPGDGLNIAHKAIIKIKDQTILTITVDKIVLNAAIPDKAFQP